jgi:hypothetical protein
MSHTQRKEHFPVHIHNKTSIMLVSEHLVDTQKHSPIITPHALFFYDMSTFPLVLSKTHTTNMLDKEVDKQHAVYIKHAQANTHTVPVVVHIAMCASAYSHLKGKSAIHKDILHA